MEPVVCTKCLLRVEQPPPNFCPSCGEDLRGLTPTSDTLSGPWAGKVIDGRYRLMEKLGEGGMGTVYRVEHVRMGKVLALKVLRPDVALDKKMKSRFQQEARVVSKLSHPNTIQVFDFGELEDSSLYIAMEFLPGRDLSWLLRSKGAFSEEKAVSIGIQMLASLAEAHDNGIIHRDIKPANAMLVKQKDREDLIKVLDFGIAKLNEGESRKHITGIADFVGTPAYMSPEQARGEDLDARSDLYSLGAMLFELVSGHPVFDGPTPMSVVGKHLTLPPPWLEQVAPEHPVSPGFEAVIRKALAKTAEERFKDANEMRAALEKVRRDAGFQSRDFTPLPDINPAQVANRGDFDRFERSLRLRRIVAPAVAAAVMLAASAGVARYYQYATRTHTLSAEAEPNDEPEQANPIALGQPVTGKIGSPLSEKDSDRDVYVLDLPEPAALSVEVSGVEDMNLVLEVFQAVVPGETGKARLAPLLVLDDAPNGQGERIDALAVAKGPVYFRIQERRFFTDPPRPPRETTKFEYRMTVTRTAAPGQMEIEPNDTLAAARPMGAAKGITAFTGAWVPYEPKYAEQSPSTADFLVADEPGEGEHVHAVLVVPPEQGSLLVTDASEFEAWRKARGEGKTPALPTALRVEKKPQVVQLKPGNHGVRIQPGDPQTPPGSSYAVAFFTPSPGGMVAVVDLAKELGGHGHERESIAVLHLAKETFPKSPQLSELQDLLDHTRVVQDTP